MITNDSDDMKAGENMRKTRNEIHIANSSCYGILVYEHNNYVSM